ncbi:hypothetical protein BKA80DRAFT_258743 [Phyllosticta citrichinensis]
MYIGNPELLHSPNSYHLSPSASALQKPESSLHSGCRKKQDLLVLQLVAPLELSLIIAVVLRKSISFDTPYGRDATSNDNDSGAAHMKRFWTSEMRTRRLTRLLAAAQHSPAHKKTVFASSSGKDLRERSVNTGSRRHNTGTRSPHSPTQAHGTRTDRARSSRKSGRDMAGRKNTRPSTAPQRRRPSQCVDSPCAPQTVSFGSRRSWLTT